MEGIAMSQEKDLTVKQVAELTEQSTDMIGDLVRMGYFPNAYKAGMGKRNSPYRIPYSDVVAYRKTQPRAA
jgi:hypothetical protein